MRITKESMLRLARDTAAISANQDRSIICIYLTGSLLTEDPFIGGTTDIDLFFVHTQEQDKKREIRYLSDDVSLDIAHIDQKRFQQPRHLRADAWLGPFLCAKPRVLLDSQHWFEFTEASVAAQFYRPEYILERARPLAAAARQTWMEFHLSQPDVTANTILRYLNTIENAGNALALLSGPPLTERRFLLDLPARLNTSGVETLISSFNSFLLPSDITDIEWTEWITRWESSLREAARSTDCHPKLSGVRRNYYTHAVNALSDEHQPAAAWILMRTWSQIAALLNEKSSEMAAWKEACGFFLQVKDSFEPIWGTLDSLLDSVEETLDIFAKDNGLVE
ncbi:hypothetical protein [Leptolinea tardivitalis]|uniref:Uncharacterized protein n=1 Tax=Leptolinea tardivitalis TaxID=229920 RepID=A0A0P6XRS8_9CHLR|nr:hypothetical protein [Leptolinea tardivitalis]KPL75156.1 hypothetical protein ADM99_00645 [Leptolinea tardivitalis]GAP20357.1 hypothetical protein LTAR_00545 [Leptolinea tardivitalis]